MLNKLKLFIMVWWFFKSYKKACLWFDLPNPLLGGITPTKMIKMGRVKKLCKIIAQQLEENK